MADEFSASTPSQRLQQQNDFMTTTPKKSLKEQIAAGAAVLVTLPKLNRPPKIVVRETITILPHQIGATIKEDAKIEENIACLDWARQCHDHIGFIIGDILNHGERHYGDRYIASLNHSCRASSTLWAYAQVAKVIPLELRAPLLTFWHHREIIRLKDKERIASALKEFATKVSNGAEFSVKDCREAVRKLLPKKQKRKSAVDESIERGTIYGPSAEPNSLDGLNQRAIDKELSEIVARIALQNHAAWAEFPARLIAHGRSVVQHGERLRDRDTSDEKEK